MADPRLIHWPYFTSARNAMFSATSVVNLSPTTIIDDATSCRRTHPFVLRVTFTGTAACVLVYPGPATLLASALDGAAVRGLVYPANIEFFIPVPADATVSVTASIAATTGVMYYSIGPG